MASAVLSDLRSRIRGTVRFDEPLAGYTTYRIGGPAAALVFPATVDDVAATLSLARESGTRWMALGLGSNVLVSDRGFDGIVLRLGKGLDGIQAGVGGEPWVWRVGAGFPTPQLARRTAKSGLSGVHRLVGIPGTVGGGAVMNAGAHGQDFGQVVSAVEMVEADGAIREIPGRDIPWHYRASGLDGGVVTSVTLRLEPADPEVLEQDVRRHLAWRKSGTPYNEPCCGSVFRNPPASASGEISLTAGQMIDALGLKGFSVGGARVSGVHANYIVNAGGATASDVLAVIHEVRARVSKEYHVELGLEVQVVV